MAEEVPIKSVEMAFEVLEVLAAEGEATLSEIQAAVGKPRSTTHDYLKSLTSIQYVVKREQRYRVSTRSLALGVRVRENMQLYQLAKPELDGIAEQTGEHVSLMIEEHGLGVLLSISKGEGALDLGVSEGWRMALSTNAPGKAILAHLPDDRIEEILDDHGLPEITEATVAERDELYDQLQTIRDRGYALDFGERVEGVRAVSVPILVRNRPFGALTISGPTNRITGQRIEDEFIEQLSQSANVIEIRYTLEYDRR